MPGNILSNIDSRSDKDILNKTIDNNNLSNALNALKGNSCDTVGGLFSEENGNL